MKIVVDTNIVISGTFFGGYPRRIVEAISNSVFETYATPEIIEEYMDIVDEMIERKQGSLRCDLWNYLISKLKIIEPQISVSVSRDPDDDKFISCAIDAKAVYIISGDKDLLDLEKFEGIEIITASEFCKKYLEE